MTKVEICTDVELYPEVTITAPEHDVSGVIPPGAFRYDVPDHLYDAYRNTLQALSALETAILRSLGFTEDRYGEWRPPTGESDAFVVPSAEARSGVQGRADAWTPDTRPRRVGCAAVDLLAALAEVTGRHPGARLMRNRVGNLSVLVADQTAGFLDLTTGEYDEGADPPRYPDTAP